MAGWLVVKGAVCSCLYFSPSLKPGDCGGAVCRLSCLFIVFSFNTDMLSSFYMFQTFKCGPTFALSL
ncbi:hypothetical protein L6452_13479 [Arctium lappa]|uniref:Uncharacterized protein n=1 Tax=Arctium lappa TaxID=4217 RepID=A0ACB9CIA5_ARCLA|nr:hypothetical protein L6452_13479 [Arctium lappa]